MQIARSLALNLGLNENLTEAISVGHDVGHTPHGHDGERILDQIMWGKDDLGGKVKNPLNHGGFKHNFHSLKILDSVEKKHIDKKGLNLTWQVLEGIFKHTRIKRCRSGCTADSASGCTNGGCWDINRFIQDPESEFSKKFKSLMDYKHSVTLEGQVVAIADEISQRQHDLDDGMRDESLNLGYDVLSNEIIRAISKIEDTPKFKNSKQLKQIIKLKKKIENKKQEKKKLTEKIEEIKLENEERGQDLKSNGYMEIYKKYLDMESYLKNTLIRDIVDYYVCDVTYHSAKNIIEYLEDPIVYKQATKKMGSGTIYTKELITFSDVAKEFDEYLEKIIYYKIINSYGVNRKNGKSIFILRQLYKAYYSNPRQMPKSVLKRLISEIYENCQRYYNIKFNDGAYLNTLDFEETSHENVERLISILKLDFKIIDLENPLELPKKLQTCNISEEIKKIPGVEVTADDEEYLLFLKCLFEINYAYMSAICDHIAGMTDNYAYKEFYELYQTACNV
jgi:dGTPase